jgi:tRNA G46 methylase TrmB
MAAMLYEVAVAFRTGRGIAPDRYLDALNKAMELMSATWLDAALVDQLLPAVDGVVGRLDRGARVADIGSGAGSALIALARRFPSSEFVGYDSYRPNVEQACAGAQAAGVGDRGALPRWRCHLLLCQAAGVNASVWSWTGA